MLLKYYKAIPVFLLFALGLGGCKKLDLAPTDRFSELTFWQVPENANNALNNVYNRMYTSGYFFNNEGLSDNAVSREGITAALASGNFTPTLSRFIDEWSYYYTGIKAANVFLENVDKSTAIDATTRDRMKGEARFIRAFHHFRLMNWWGDVPLVNTNITEDQAKAITRTPKAQVLQFILAELDAAAAVLPTRNQYQNADRGRITKGAAKALKARVLLYEGNRMAEVAAICEDLMNNQGANGTYSLVPKYEDVFSPNNEYNSEVILDMQYVPNQRTWGEYFDYAPLSGGARTNGLAPTQELVNSYIMTNGKRINEAGSGYDEANPYANRDPRLGATVVFHGASWRTQGGANQTIYIRPGSDPDRSAKNEYSASGQGTLTGYYWRKYYDPTATANFSSGLNLILIRYADVLLMYAEAKQSLGQMTEDVWNKTIRPLRVRAGFTDPGALSFPGTANMTETIRNERRTEFAFEGLRIDDIRRWKVADQVMNGWAHGAKFGDPSVDNGYIRAQFRTFEATRHYLWPVPAQDIGKNPNLTQNPNY